MKRIKLFNYIGNKGRDCLSIFGNKISNMDAAIRKVKSNEALLKVIYYSGIYFILNTLFDQKGVYVLCYHRLTNYEADSSNDPMAVDRSSFEKHMEFLKREYDFISLDQAVDLLGQKKKLRKRYLVVTFDDGYRDNYVFGREIFSKYGLKPTIYLTAGKIDQRSLLWHDSVDYMVFGGEQEEVLIDTAGIKGRFPIRTEAEKRSLAEKLKESIKQFHEDAKGRILDDLAETFGVCTQEESCLLLDWAEIQSLISAGADMGGHTMSHPILSRVSDVVMKQEVSACKKLIEERTRKEVRSFAYTNGKSGDYTNETKKEVANHYKSAVTTIMGVNKPGADLYELRRILIGYDPDILKLRFKMLQAKLSSKQATRVGWGKM